MSEPANQVLQQTRLAPRKSVVNGRLRKLAAAAAGALTASPQAAGLPVFALGAGVALCAHLAYRPNVEELGSSMSRDEAQEALSARGMAPAESAFALSALQGARVAVLTGGLLTLPAFEQQLEVHLRSATNRAAGWGKRTGLPQTKTERPSFELEASAEPRSKAPPVLAGSTTQGAAAAPPAATGALKSSRKPRPGSTYRVTATDSEQPPLDDPTVVRIRTECGGVAEITQSYIEQLSRVFTQVDVEGQIRLAGNWSESNPSRRKTLSGIPKFLNAWLTNATRDASMRAALSRAGRQGNGFGKGETSFEPSTPTVGAGVPDEFDDLLSASTAQTWPIESDAPAQRSLLTPAAPKVSSVMVARARLPVGSGQRPGAAPRPAQRRLSEQLN